MPGVHPAECYLAQIFVGLRMYFALDQLALGKFCSFPQFFSKGLIFRIDLEPDLLGLFDRFFDDRSPKNNRMTATYERSRGDKMVPGCS